MEIPVQKPPPLIQQRPEIYPTRIKRPNPLLELSYNRKLWLNNYQNMKDY